MRYTYTRPDGGTGIYSDPKRYLFALVLAVNFAVPFLAMALYWTFDRDPLWSLALLVYFFGVIPLVDFVLGEDRSNPPEAAVPELSDDPYYRTLLLFSVPMFYIVYIGGVWFLMTQDLPIWAQVAFAVGIGLVNGNANTIGHELGHKSNAVDQLFARLALISIGNGHFTQEHNRHHHSRVSTPDDYSSARLGENLYAFALRDIPGAVRGAWQLEKERLARRGYRVVSLHNQLLVNWGASAALALILAVWLGWSALIFIALYKFVALFTLTLANYIEHYGLLRRTQENGRYEPCGPEHSWNTNHLFSNLATVHLQRHSDHHVNPMRPYQSLRHFEGVPALPSGYPGCFGLALVPPVWFAIMDKKALAWADGDPINANIAPELRDKLLANQPV